MYVWPGFLRKETQCHNLRQQEEHSYSMFCPSYCLWDNTELGSELLGWGYLLFFFFFSNLMKSIFKAQRPMKMKTKKKPTKKDLIAASVVSATACASASVAGTELEHLYLLFGWKVDGSRRHKWRGRKLSGVNYQYWYLFISGLSAQNPSHLLATVISVWHLYEMSYGLTNIHMV